MRLLILFTSYRQIEELDYQAQFLRKCNFLSAHSDVLFHCNNRQIPIDSIQEKLKQLPVNNTQVIYGSNQGGYLRGQFQAIADTFTLGIFDSYDFVIHLHPDIFIVDEKPIVEIINSRLARQSDICVARIFGNSDPSFATDFFIFRPSIILAKLFSSYTDFDEIFESPLPLERIFYQLIHKLNIKYLEVERFKLGRYFRDIDELGLWHEHRLLKVRLYFKSPQLRYILTVSDFFKNPKLSLAIFRDYILRKYKGEKQDNLLKLLSR